MSEAQGMRAELVEAPDSAPSTGSGQRLRQAQGTSAHNPNRQTVLYCPYCAEETLFPLEKGWECRSCLRAFSVTFLGLRGREVTTS
jgi:hypothetical protein